MKNLSKEWFLKQSGTWKKRDTQWIEQFRLKPHIEGGYFVATYQSPDTTSNLRFPTPDSAERIRAKGIYFLLWPIRSRNASLKCENLGYHCGTSLTLSIIHRDGTLQQIRTWICMEQEEQLQVTVPRVSGFGATVNFPYHIRGSFYYGPCI
jgi:predicted cupin superfamily sugar epimerase